MKIPKHPKVEVTKCANCQFYRPYMGQAGTCEIKLPPKARIEPPQLIAETYVCDFHRPKPKD